MRKNHIYRCLGEEVGGTVLEAGGLAALHDIPKSHSSIQRMHMLQIAHTPREAKRKHWRYQKKRRIKSRSQNEKPQPAKKD